MTIKTYEDFMKSADSRETSEEVMEAIMNVSKSADDAVRIWESTTREEFIAVWERSTKNGLIDGNDLFWGGNTMAQLQRDWN